MKPDVRNLTPMRALSLLRRLDEHVCELPGGTCIRAAVSEVRDALDNHIRYGLARARRRKRKR